jgi:hypothetical protein
MTPPPTVRPPRPVRVLVALLAGSAAATAPAPAAAHGVRFDRDVRPVLSDKCFPCHGPDAATRQADLRLDTREGLTASAVVPGDPQASELLRRIVSVDPDVRMPPPDSGLSLSEDERARLRAWIAEGAEVTSHWSFAPLPAETPLPDVRDAGWPRQPLDHFVRARLEAEGLAPSPAAAPWKLLRRLRLDLTGLPPTAAEVAAFEAAAADNLDAATEAAVDRLLALPAFGEHFAVAWLDAARYADSYGIQSDQLNPQWPYRDWVVRALNANLPYDQFLTWQLAGDLLDDPTSDQILATAFNRLHRLTNEGGSIPEEWLVENAADRLHTFGTAMLGLTLECARCHDHKYDPIPQRDYYALLGFFNSIDENGLYDSTEKVPSPTLLLPTLEQQHALQAATEEAARAEAAWRAAVAGGTSRFDAWQATASAIDPQIDLVAYASFDADDSAATGVAAFSDAGGVDPDHPAPPLETVPGARGRAVLFDGDRRLAVVPKDQLLIDRRQRFAIDMRLLFPAVSPLPQVVAQQTSGTDVGPNGFDLLLRDGRLEARLYRVWPGNAIGVRSTAPLRPGVWQRITLTYDGSSRAQGFRLYLDGQPAPVEIVRDRIVKRAALTSYGDGSFSLGGRFRDRGFRDGLIDELRLYRRDLAPLEVALLGSAAPSLPPDVDPEQLRAYYFSAVDPPSRQRAEELTAARQEAIDAEEPIHEVSVMRELPQPRPTHVLARGAYDAPRSAANRVERDVFSQILPPFPAAAPRNRLGLATWLTAGDHPLTARVAVNRIWTHFFGAPLAATPENLGSQGARPEHPALLDWLARDFADHGWDMKRLCRQIACSATYRQDSQRRTDLAETDPQNRLLARGPSRRLKAEQIRDLALAASGLLVDELGGPPVAPYQAGGDLWRAANAMSPAYRQSTGAGLHRRSLYSVWKRTAPLPNMLAFDAPTREVCTVSRSHTATPLQALVLLNDQQFVEAARGLALRVAAEGASAGDRLAAAFLLVAGRRPEAREQQLLEALYAEQRGLFAAGGGQDAARLAAVGEAARSGDAASAETAALTVACQAILNLDAAIVER